jgi:hypothetical protein
MYRRDPRYQMFSLWTSDTHLQVALEIIYTPTPSHRHNTYVYQMTAFVCGKCKGNSRLVYPGTLYIALNPKLLFDGDTLICEKCIIDRYKVDGRECVVFERCVDSEWRQTHLKFTKELLKNKVYIYNVPHDYYRHPGQFCIKPERYRASDFDPYYNFHELTLFDLLLKNLKS